MLEIPEDRGNAVKIRSVIIPTVNIQTEVTEEYNLYFEVLFENGVLWIVYLEDKILWVDVYRDWAHETNLIEEPDNKRAYKDWEMFLYNYKRFIGPVISTGMMQRVRGTYSNRSAA